MTTQRKRKKLRVRERTRIITRMRMLERNSRTMAAKWISKRRRKIMLKTMKNYRKINKMKRRKKKIIIVRDPKNNK